MDARKSSPETSSFTRGRRLIARPGQRTGPGRSLVFEPPASLHDSDMTVSDRLGTV